MRSTKNKLFLMILGIIMLFKPISILAMNNLDIESTDEVYQYDSINLTVQYEKKDVTKAVTWTTSDKNIATIDNNGVLTANSFGNVTITAECTNDKGELIKAEKTVNIQGVYMVIQNKDSSKTSNMYTLNSKIILPVFIKEKLYSVRDNIKVASSNDKVAKVKVVPCRDSNNQIVETHICIETECLSVGSTDITASVDYKGHKLSDTYTLTVVSTDTKIEENTTETIKTETKNNTKTSNSTTIKQENKEDTPETETIDTENTTEVDDKEPVLTTGNSEDSEDSEEETVDKSNNMLVIGSIAFCLIAALVIVFLKNKKS